MKFESSLNSFIVNVLFSSWELECNKRLITNNKCCFKGKEVQ